MANEIIRPTLLPSRTNPVASEVTVSDNGAAVAGVTWTDGVNAAVPVASQAEAEAGVDNSKRMTPLTTKQAIDEQVGPKIATAIGDLNLGTMAQENAVDFVPAVRTVGAGAGLTGGGSLAANRTLALSSASIASLAKADSAVQTVNGQFPDGSGNVLVNADFVQDQDTVATAAAESFAPDVEWVRTAGFAVAGDGGGALYNKVGGQPSHPFKFQSNDGAWWELAVGSALTPDVTVIQIPTHFADLPTAFAWLRNRPVPMGKTVDLRLNTGYSIVAGVAFSNDDFSRIRITSQGGTVSVGSTFVGVNVTSDPFEANSLFVCFNSRGPTLACLINMGTYGGCGVVLTTGSSCVIGGGCGVYNAGAFGLYVNTQSRCIATNSNFSLAGWGNRVTVNSFLSAPQANFSGARNATYLTTNTVANMDVSRGSVVYVTGAVGGLTNLSGGAGHGLAVRRSFCSATNVNCNNNGLSGLQADLGSNVAFTGSTANDCADGIVCFGSKVDANNGSATGNSRYNAYADSGGDLTARNGTFTGAGAAGARAANGSRMNVSGANCRMGGSDSANDIWATQGSIIHASGATGGTNIATLTLNVAGLIFK